MKADAFGHVVMAAVAVENVPVVRGIGEGVMRMAMCWGMAGLLLVAASGSGRAELVEASGRGTVLDLLVDDTGRPAIVHAAPDLSTAIASMTAPGQPSIIWTLATKGALADPDAVSLTMTNRPGGAIALAPDHVVRWLLRASGSVPRIEGEAGARLCLRSDARGIIMRNEGAVTVLIYSRTRSPASMGDCGSDDAVDVSR